MQVLSASSVMKLHVPLMIPIIKDQLQDSAKKGNTLWHEDMRQIAFKVSAQAVLGSLISNKLLQELYDLFKVMAAGAFDMVRMLLSCFRFYPAALPKRDLLNSSVGVFFETSTLCTLMRPVFHILPQCRKRFITAFAQCCGCWCLCLPISAVS